MAAINPKKLNWTNPTAYTDGSVYAAATDNAGYTLQLDGVGAVSIPLAFGTSYDLTSLDPYKTLKRGTHTLALAAVSKEGIQSDFSPPLSFQIAVAPVAPTALGLV